MKKTILALAIAFIALVSISSCKKEEIEAVYDINVESKTMISGLPDEVVFTRTENYLTENGAKELCKVLTRTTTSSSDGVTVTIKQTATYNICKGHTGGSTY